MAEEKGAEVDKEDVYLSVSPDDGWWWATNYKNMLWYTEDKESHRIGKSFSRTETGLHYTSNLFISIIHVWKIWRN